jgi:hypothetical protein
MQFFWAWQLLRSALKPKRTGFKPLPMSVSQFQTAGLIRPQPTSAGWHTRKAPASGFLAVYAPMPTSGDPVADFKAVWKRIVLNTGKYKGYPG